MNSLARALGTVLAASSLTAAIVAVNVSASPTASHGQVPEEGGEVRYASLTRDGHRYEPTPETDSELWASKDPAELVSMLMISREEIEAMSTDGLVASALDYPYFGDFMAFSSTQEGFESLRRKCPAVAELAARPDAAETLWRWHRSPRVSQLMASDEFGSLRQMWLKVLLTREEVLDSASPELRAEILAATQPKE